MTLWASLVIDNIGALVTMDHASGLGVVDDAVIVLDADRIAWLGARAELPQPIAGVPRIDAGGRCVFPGLIDCHTHAMFVGTRADEFARRARGESYQDIMAAGGGIRSTMRAVRSAPQDDLFAHTSAQLDRMLARGVTTVEVKSGYGLDVKNELKMLRAMRELSRRHVVEVVPTLLAAHAVPPEFDVDGGADRYVDVMVSELLPEVVKDGLATTCDVFVEQGAFSVAQARRMLSAAQAHGLGVRVHAEQMSHSGGAQLAAELGAHSAGHLEHVTRVDADALAAAGVVCEVLSTAQVFMRGQRAIPGRMLADAGCTIAVATDFNPGTAMCSDLLLAAGLAITQCGLTAEQALRGITVNAAAALRLPDRGVLAVGKRADIAIMDVTSPYELLYRWSDVRAHAVVIAGKQVRGSPSAQ